MKNNLALKRGPLFTISYLALAFVIVFFDFCKAKNYPLQSGIMPKEIQVEVLSFNRKYHGLKINDLGRPLESHPENTYLSDGKTCLILFRSLNACPSCNFDAEDILLRVSRSHPKLPVLEVFFVQNQYAFDRLSSRLEISKIGLILSSQYKELQSKPFFAFINDNGQLRDLVPFISEEISNCDSLLQGLIKYNLSNNSD